MAEENNEDPWKYEINLIYMYRSYRESIVIAIPIHMFRLRI
jgi:hypothetical protein